MQTAEILSSSFLDILFENRNKDYGAYDLRKSYNKRLGTSLLILLSILLLSALLFLFGNKSTNIPKVIPDIPPNITTVISQPDKIIIPQPKKINTSVVPQTFHNATPLIIKDNTKPLPSPDISEIENAHTGFKGIPGNSNIDLVNPYGNTPGSNTLVAPLSPHASEDSIRINVEIEASFPGGISEWSKYLKRTIERNQDEFTSADYGTCLVKFVVDKNGVVSDVKALSMQNTRLAEVAIKVIKNGPHWIPAFQNGHKVSAYRTQPITMIEENE